MTSWQIIAWDGEHQFIVSLDGQWQDVKHLDRPLGRVLNTKRGKLYQPVNLHSLFSKHGGWEEIALPASEQERVLLSLQRGESS
ncbi:hypothetical protein [Armatimonas sp.]|uniref:hypothetical protein n=1 Tax=Armatimonas sp. TaxID=1872638 RepID=UPI00286C3F44|nr:hypothetical protein [Armatimonas sp.]